MANRETDVARQDVSFHGERSTEVHSNLFAERARSEVARNKASGHNYNFVDEAMRLPKLIIDGFSKYDLFPNLPKRVEHLVNNLVADPVHPFTRVGANRIVALVGVKITVDNDGAGGNREKDLSYESNTTWHYRGRALNANTTSYSAIPGDLAHWGKNRQGKVELGTLVIVERHGRLVACVAGDVGNSTSTLGRGIGEVSVHAAEQLGLDSSPKTGGSEDHDAKVIFTNEKVMGISDQELQKQAREWL
ncbi:hypothetical protein BH10CYA1_BH10CYA1_48170 [soil metagenome]